MENKNEFIVLKKVYESDDSYHWDIMDLNVPYEGNKPILLVLGGNGTQDDKSTKGNGNIVSSSLGVFEKDVDMFCVNYNNNELFTAAMAKLVKWLLTTLISDNGKKLDIDLACKKVRTLTIASHCYGSGPIWEEFVYQTSVLLDNFDYLDDEQTKILQQIFSVNVAFFQQVSYISGLDILSISDSVFQHEGIKLTKRFLKNTKNILMNNSDYNNFKTKDDMASYAFINDSDRCYIFPEGNRISLIAGNLKNNANDHSFANIKRGKDWTILDDSTPTGEAVSRCASCALCNSVANSMLNIKSKKHIPLNINELTAQMEEATAQINELTAVEPSL